MNGSANPPPLNARGCCETGPRIPTLSNRPGLPALAYRIGTYPDFLRRMLARLPTQTVPDAAGAHARPMRDLTTRAPDDPAIALLDAWATLADVLTFYQERIANEGYLHTATERRSVLELARTIGYELNPGVAAAAYLAFTVESATGAPGQAVVPKGTRVQSVPAQGQLPQTFETMAAITARAEWNALHPLLTQPQQLSLNAQTLYLAGIANNLAVGDLLLLVAPPDGDPHGALQTNAVRIQKVTLDSDLQRTRVDLVGEPKAPPVPVPPLPPMGQISIDKIPFVAVEVQQRILGLAWRERDLRAFLAIQGWQAKDLLKYVADYGRMIAAGATTAPGVIATPPSAGPAAPSLPAAIAGVFTFRARTAFFGNTAPLYSSLPYTLTGQPPPTPPISPAAQPPAPPFQNNWDAGGGTTIWTDSQGTLYSSRGSDVYLERVLQQMLPGSWTVFESPGLPSAAYRVARVSEESLADYALTGRATGLALARIDGVTGPDTSALFRTRRTTAYAQSDQLTLGDLTIDDTVPQGSLSVPLDSMVLNLDVGQPVVVSGERVDLPGVTVNEIAILADVVHALGTTTLWFTAGLQYSYSRKTMVINANVVQATHGATVLSEVLGSGDGSQPNQRFTLKKPPLTYVSAPTATGAQSTLQVQVNGIAWQQVPSLYGLDGRSQSYIVRIDNNFGATVIFGDGVMGARLPSGTENVTATYRSGIGQPGMVAAGSLTLLQTRPLGIRGVVNPGDASGAADPEGQDSARANAPLTVLTLERIVSLQDAEDFTRAFAGIGKAQAVALWLGVRHLVHLTVAAMNGQAVDPTSALYTNFVAAIARAADPVLSFQVDSYQPLFFNLSAEVLVDPHYDSATVLAAVQAGLAAAFSFDQRAFGQPVTAAEVVTLVQAMPGVVATDLRQLYLVSDGSGLQSVLPAASAQVANGQIAPGQLLLLNPAGVTLTEMQP